MFVFRKKHKYTAYHANKGDNNYTMDSEDDESESFLVDDLDDISSDDQHDDLPKDSWPKPQNHKQSKSESKSIPNRKNEPFLFEFPDPEIAEVDDRKDTKNKMERNKMEKKKEEEKKPKFMSRMLNAIRNKTKNIGKKQKDKKLKGKYDKTFNGERSVTPSTSENSNYEKYIKTFPYPK